MIRAKRPWSVVAMFESDSVENVENGATGIFPRPLHMPKVLSYGRKEGATEYQS